MTCKFHIIRNRVRDEIALTSLAVGLHEAGAPAHVIEDTFAAAARGIDLEAELFATPTSLMVTSGTAEEPRARFVRVSPFGFDLGRLTRLTGLARALAAAPSAEEATAMLHDSADVPNPVRNRAGIPNYVRDEAGIPNAGQEVRGLEVASYGVIGGSAALLLGGGPPEAGAALVGGLVVGGIAALVDGRPGLGPLMEPVSALCAAFLAALLVPGLGGGSALIATTAALIVLVPGFTMTTAMTELATGHVASGTNRVTMAMTTLVGLGVGAAMGFSLVADAGSGPATPYTMPTQVEWGAVLMGSLAFGILFRTDGRDLVWVVLAGVFGYVAGEATGPAGAAFAVAMGAQLAARLGRPPALVEVPAIMMLVPGSVGFRGIATMNSDFVGGLETGFSMVVIAASLTVGLLAAKVLFYARGCAVGAPHVSSR